MLRARSGLILVILAASALSIAIGTAGCDSAPASTADPDLLENTSWRLIRLGGMSVSDSNPAIVPTITFLSADDRVSGSGGCNQYSGGYEIDGETVELGLIASTLMACAEGMDIESIFFATLERVGSWKVDGGTLELFDAEGGFLMRFTV